MTKNDFINEQIHKTNGFIRQFCYVFNTIEKEANEREERRNKLKEKLKERKEKKNE